MCPPKFLQLLILPPQGLMSRLNPVDNQWLYGTPFRVMTFITYYYAYIIKVKKSRVGELRLGGDIHPTPHLPV